MKRSIRLAVLVVVSTAALVPLGTRAGAYTRTYTDGEDVRGPLDLVEVRIDHGRSATTYKFGMASRVRGATLKLARERYVLIAYDQDRARRDSRPYERCVFVFHQGGLRWLATDCRDHLLRDGRATQPNARTIGVKLPLGLLQLGRDHEWAVLTVWAGAPCGTRGCVDRAPNRPPLYLHDVTSPRISFRLPAVSTGLTSSTTSIPVSFSVTDKRGSGVESWELWGARPFMTPYELVASGSGNGQHMAMHDVIEGATYSYYVEAYDAFGNVAESEYPEITVPTDDASFMDRAVSGNVQTVADPDAFGGSVTVLHDVGSTLTFLSGGPQCDDDAWLIGDGRGDWTIKFTKNGDTLGTVSSSDIPDGTRKIIWRTRGQANFCGGDVTVELLAGSDAKIDAFGSH